MSSRRRRAYPQPNYAAQSPYGATTVPTGNVAPGAPSAYSVDQAAQGISQMNINGAGAVPQGVTGVRGAATPLNPVSPNIPTAGANPVNSAYYQQQSQQSVPLYPQQQGQQPQQQQQQQQQGQQSQQLGYQPMAQQQQTYLNQPEYGQQGPGAAPLNMLYSTDLLKELPPPIADLQFPPPPIVLPANATTTGSESSNADYQYFRSTLNVIPNTSSLLKKSKLPFAIVVRPYITLHDSDNQIPVVSDCVIARCRRCRAYINPFIHFTENGRRWRCNFCGLLNDVPSAFDYDSVTSQPAQRMERSELNHGVVEFVAPPEYMIRPPQPLVYVFVLDVCKFSIDNGLLATVTRTILDSLDRIPNKEGRARIAFMAVDSSISYFAIPRDEETDKETKMMIVSDTEETLIPAPEGILVNLKESRKNIEKLLQEIPSYFANNMSTDSALGPALKSAHSLISRIGGKIEVFTSTLPNIGIGKLKVRDENAVANKPKEASELLTPNSSFYKSFAVECNKSQVTVDMFLTGSSYQDVASLSNLPRFTAGQTHFYPAWSANSVEDITKLSKEVSNHLSMDIALEAVLRVRGSNGMRMQSFFGNFFNRSSDLCSFPSFPRDQSYVIEVSIEDYITKPIVYFQCAVLHTTCFGERRIRVMTLAIPTSKDLKSVYASADQLAITNYFTHRAIEKTMSSSLDDARDYLRKSVVDILSLYKKEIVPGNMGSSSPLQLCTNLRMLPLLLQSLAKNIAFRSGRVPSDHRAAALNKLGSMPLPYLIRAIYPSVYSLHTMPDDCGLPYEGEEEEGEDEPAQSSDLKRGEIVIPEPVNASCMNLARYGLYLIDNTSELFLYVGGDAVPQLIEDVFGVQNIADIKIGKAELPELENEFNTRVRNIISKVREGKDTIEYLNLYVVVGPGSNESATASANRDLIPLRIWCMSDMVEDRATSNVSYKEYLGQLREKVSS